MRVCDFHVEAMHVMLVGWLVFGTVAAKQDEKQATHAVAKKFPYLKPTREVKSVLF